MAVYNSYEIASDIINKNDTNKRAEELVKAYRSVLAYNIPFTKEGVIKYLQGYRVWYSEAHQYFTHDGSEIASDVFGLLIKNNYKFRTSDEFVPQNCVHKAILDFLESTGFPGINLKYSDLDTYLLTIPSEGIQIDIHPDNFNLLYINYTIEEVNKSLNKIRDVKSLPWFKKIINKII